MLTARSNVFALRDRFLEAFDVAIWMDARLGFPSRGRLFRRNGARQSAQKSEAANVRSTTGRVSPLPLTNSLRTRVLLHWPALLVDVSLQEAFVWTVQSAVPVTDEDVGPQPSKLVVGSVVEFNVICCRFGIYSHVRPICLQSISKCSETTDIYYDLPPIQRPLPASRLNLGPVHGTGLSPRAEVRLRTCLNEHTLAILSCFSSL